MKDLAAMLPRMPVVLFHYNPAVPWKALAVRAVEALADQEPEASGEEFIDPEEASQQPAEPWREIP